MQAVTQVQSRPADAMILGGASLAILPLAIWWDQHSGYQPPATLGMMLLALFSMPHFLEVYRIFYGTPGLRKRNKMAGYGVPFLALMVFSWFGMKSDEGGATALVGTTTAMLAWHFVMQAFGSARYLGFPARMKWVFWFGALWCFSQAFLKPEFPGLFSLIVFPVHVPQTLVNGIDITWCLILTYTTLFSLQQRNLASIVPLLAVSAWFLPDFNSGLYGAFIPAFHGLQFAFFAGIRERSQPSHHGDGGQVHIRLVAYIFIGVMFFMAFPHFFVDAGKLIVNPGRLFAAMWMFLTVHHVALESVMWRRDQSPNTKGRS